MGRARDGISKARSYVKTIRVIHRYACRLAWQHTHCLVDLSLQGPNVKSITRARNSRPNYSGHACSNKGVGAYLPERRGLQEMLNRMRLMKGACVSIFPISCTARTTPDDTTSACVASFDTRAHSRRRM